LLFSCRQFFCQRAQQTLPSPVGRRHNSLSRVTPHLIAACARTPLPTYVIDHFVTQLQLLTGSTVLNKTFCIDCYIRSEQPQTVDPRAIFHSSSNHVPNTPSLIDVSEQHHQVREEAAVERHDDSPNSIHDGAALVFDTRQDIADECDGRELTRISFSSPPSLPLSQSSHSLDDGLSQRNNEGDFPPAMFVILPEEKEQIEPKQHNLKSRSSSHRTHARRRRRSPATTFTCNICPRSFPTLPKKQ
jgi:hypothetical protein